MNMYNPYANPYMPTAVQEYMPAPRMEIQRVTGEESAKKYPIGPNSSVILLDTDNPLIWVVTTDASGFKTVTPFAITPYEPEKPVSTDDLRNQLSMLTDRIEKLEGMIDGRESDNGASGKDKSGNANAKPNGRNG